MLRILTYDENNTSFGFTARAWLENLSEMHVDFTTTLREYEAADLIIGPIDWIRNNCFRMTSKTFIYTANESTRMRPKDFAVLNSIAGVIVPSYWCASCLSAQGLEVPIHVCHLGHDIVEAKPNNLSSQNLPVKFAAVGAQTGFYADRKNIMQIVDCFRAANLVGQAELFLRIDTTEEFQSLLPQNVKIVRRMNRPDYLRWMESMNIGVFLSKGEGFCIPALEFQAMGRPLIVPNVPPFNEFCYIDPNLSPSAKMVRLQETNLGSVFAYDYDELVDSYQIAVERCNELNLLTQRVAQFAAHKTWRHSTRRLLQILNSDF